MLPFRCEEEKDYSARLKTAEKHFIKCPDVANRIPLIIQNRHGLEELSFALFTGWVFFSILNPSEVRISIIPVGTSNESSLLVIHQPGTDLVVPSRKESDLLVPDYFKCPQDGNRTQVLSTVMPCPVVNKLRYNLAQAHPNRAVTNLREPDKTQDCCKSGKEKLWQYIMDTLNQNSDLYGSMVGGSAFPIKLPFDILKKYLTGCEGDSQDFGKLLEETLLWFAIAASKSPMGFPHFSFTKPFESNEIDVLLYETAGKNKKQKPDAGPPGGWKNYIREQAICILEFTVGHRLEKKSGSDPAHTNRYGKDVPKNKLINFLALREAGFRHVQAHYITMTGESDMAEATKKTLQSTQGFQYVCLSDDMGEDIEQLVSEHFLTPVSAETCRKWHSRLIEAVETIGMRFHQDVGNT